MRYLLAALSALFAYAVVTTHAHSQITYDTPPAAHATEQP